MKTRLLLPVLLVALSLASAFSQAQEAQITAPLRIVNPTPGAPPPGFPQPAPSNLTKFSLDFPGGTPQQLVTAIEKAMSKPLNVIISPEHADFTLPPLKMNKVDVGQLFQALELTSQKTEAIPRAGFAPGNYEQRRSSYGFRTQGAQSDDSIWYFVVEKPLTPPPQIAYVAPKVCRYYPLTSHLERGLTVDDITTAIQTGWKMLGDQETPTISFHKETKLLIAVGDEAKLQTIDAVLKALQPAPPLVPRLPVAALPSVAPKPSEQPKTGN